MAVKEEKVNDVDSHNIESFYEDPRNYNAKIIMLNEEGKMQLDEDKIAVKKYFTSHVNKKIRRFDTLDDKLDYLIENEYYDENVINLYSRDFIKKLHKMCSSYDFRFNSLMGALKFYESYGMKSFDGTEYFENYEDRVVMNALFLADGNEDLAISIAREIMTRRYQPATPTFLNAGKKQRGSFTSCYLLSVEDNLESIDRSITNAMQLSKRGGGVALNLTNLRERGAPIKKMKNQSSGVIPVMKLYEHAFQYANQLGQRQGAGAVYLNAHHLDIEDFLDTKKENADEAIRIKTLSLGVVIPDITYELAKRNEDMYLFSPYDVERTYGVPFAQINVSEKYYEMVENDSIRKRAINARDLFTRIASLQFESGYPYVMHEDVVNRAHNNSGKITMSNLCVAPETRVLTDTGYHEIASLVGQEVNAWNGKEFSKSLVAKTGEAKPLITVNFSNGASLDVTPYHKFYVKETYKKNAVEVRAGELQVGDKLDKFDLPVINSSNIDMPYAYTSGFFTADGTYGRNSVPKVSLYGEKKKLISLLDIRSSSFEEDSSGRVNVLLPRDIVPKFFVPLNYSTKSKLEWLSGLIDGDGYGNGILGIQIASINKNFIEELRILLTTLGIHSKVSLVKDEELRYFKNGNKEYNCKPLYRIVISGTSTQELLKLGLKTHRVKIEEYDHQRKADHFVTVTSIEDNGRISDTYCLNEPKEHKVVFEGIQTGNCTEILMTSTPSTFKENNDYDHVGRDISCNLGSLNVDNAFNSEDFAHTIDTAIRSLTTVTEKLDDEVECVPPVKRGNQETHAIGLGQMNLHGFFARNGIFYDSPEAVDFTRMYFYSTLYHCLKTSNAIAIERGENYPTFKESKYASGEFFNKFTVKELPTFETDKVKNLFESSTIYIPTREDWIELKESVMKHGIYHAYIQAVAPTGNISYVNEATSSIHPIVAPIEIRKDGTLGRTYVAMPHLSEETAPYYRTAYDIDNKAIIDVYAAAQEFVDQGLSLTLFYRDTDTTRDVVTTMIYAWTKGIKTIYYARVKTENLDGTGEEDANSFCADCMI